MEEKENNEQEKKEENKTESSTDNSGEGNISELTKATDEANKASERMANERRQLEAATAKAKLAGVTEAGKPAKKPKEISNKDYMNEVMAGEHNIKGE